ncbi:MAG: anti-sigma factor domain-containing protein, partial [Acidimicrobiales bacterium]
APPPPGRRWGVPAVMAVALLIAGGLFTQLQVRSDRLETTMQHIELLERAQLATTDPAAVVTTLRTTSNDPVLTVVSRPGGGRSYATNSSLRPLAPGQSYELWRVKNGTVTAAAALGRRPDLAVFSIPPGVSGFLLTAERSPLPRRPTLPAVATGLIFP